MKSKIFIVLLTLLIISWVVVISFFNIPAGLGILVIISLGFIALSLITLFIPEDSLQKTFVREKYNRDWAIWLFKKWCGIFSYNSSYSLSKEGFAQRIGYKGIVLEQALSDGIKYSFALPGGMFAELVLASQYFETETEKNRQGEITFSKSEWNGYRIAGFTLVSKGIVIAEYDPCLKASMRFVSSHSETTLILT